MTERNKIAATIMATAIWAVVMVAFDINAATSSLIIGATFLVSALWVSLLLRG